MAQTGLVQRYAFGTLLGILVIILIYYNDWLKL